MNVDLDIRFVPMPPEQRYAWERAMRILNKFRNEARAERVVIEPCGLVDQLRIEWNFVDEEAM